MKFFSNFFVSIKLLQNVHKKVDGNTAALTSTAAQCVVVLPVELHPVSPNLFKFRHSDRNR